MSSAVKLSIKAANGSVNDYRVEAQLDWTVQQLKNHLYRHYPTHPPVTSQKLIYGGRLLLNHQTIEQSLPIDNTDPIIVHLVAYERSLSAPVISSTVEDKTLRSQLSSPPVSSHPPVSSQRSTASRQPSLTPVQEDDSLQAESTPQQQPNTTSTNPWLRFRGQLPPTTTPPIQLPYGAPVHNIPGIPPGMMPMGGYQFPAQFYMSPYGAAYANQMAQWYNAYYGRQAPPTASEDDNLLNPPEAPQNNEDVDVEDDVPMNAAGGAGLGMMAGGGGGMLHNRRDLVDILYMCTMFGFLGLVAYLTGSVGRLLVFAGGIIFMLLNQGGWFSVRRRRQAPQVDDVNPLNRPDQLPQEQADQQDNHQEQENTEQTDNQDRTTDEPVRDDSGDSDRPTPPQPTQPIPQDQQRPGILATLFVFVTSFFTSLVPHQRPELQVN